MQLKTLSFYARVRIQDGRWDNEDKCKKHLERVVWKNIISTKYKDIVSCLNI